jgi:hypothetical protein
VTRVARALVAVAVGGLAIVSVLGFGDVSPASAVSGLESGWWWRLQDGTGTVPAPPTVDPGSMWLAADPTGPLAMAAIRFTMAENEAAPIITLDVDRTTNPTAVSLLACLATEQWEVATAGAWSARPKYDCSAGSVAGAFSLDDTKVQFDLGTIATTRTIDVVLLTGTAPPLAAVPAPPVPLPVPAPTLPPPPAVVDVTVRQPTLQSIDIVEVQPFPDAGGASDFVPAPVEFVDEFVDDFVAPALDLPAATVPVVAGGSAPPVVNVVPTGQVARALPLVDDDGATRAIAGAVFALLALWWWRLSSAQPAARARLVLGDDPTLVAPPTQRREGRPIPLR